MNTTFHKLKVGWTMCYLLKGSDGYLLLDTAFAKYYPVFLQELSRIGVDLREIKWLLLTHHHDDHAGFAAKLIAETGARVIVHREAVMPLGRGVFEFPGALRPANLAVDIAFRLHNAITRRKTEFSPLAIGDDDIVLSGSDELFLRSIGIDGQILHTPGHTKDSLSVLLADGNAFVGDLASSFLNFLGVRYRPPYYEDLQAVIRSWDELGERGAKTVYPAHGKPFSIRKLQRHTRVLD